MDLELTAARPRRAGRGRNPNRPRDPNNPHDFHVRRRIFNYIRHVPGSYLRQMQRELGIPLATLEYHLYRMERQGTVVTRNLARFKAYFTCTSLDRRDRDYLYFLRQRMPRRIAREVLRSPDLTFSELSRRFAVSASTVSFHLSKLVRVGMVDVAVLGRERSYRLAEPDRVRQLLEQYCVPRPGSPPAGPRSTAPNEARGATLPRGGAIQELPTLFQSPRPEL